ncbi:YheC/YheD family protein [Paenibacillus sp. OV219]|uniref:YheC/YheD family endospore coat-associated protein n=1 Tax=Paenibacillus sp. OV219 TaxID=1884377 RepID=UPI0008B45FE9|nr:YheC/YheD family protein [Paenibacillus sp. OV219]SEO76057.1 YheC/D like ATP-grasp [Paenibacillus sp. OV219]
MEDRPLIGILVSNKSNRKSVLELYQRYDRLNLHLFAFTPSDINWENQRINGLSLNKGVWKQSSFAFPKVVYNRSFNKKTITIQRLENVIGTNKCFNKINFFSKWDLYNLFKQSELNPYIPETLSYDQANVSELLEKYHVVYIKPAYGFKGKSVYRVEQTNHGDVNISLYSLAPRYICRHNESYQGKLGELLGSENYMVQQGIFIQKLNHRYFDIRVLVQKDISGAWTVSTLACRVAYEHYFNTSMCEFIYDAAEVIPLIFSQDKTNEIFQSLHEVSIAAAQVAEAHIGSLGELSVDFAIDEQGKLWIIELNGKPQKSIYKDMKSSKHKNLVYSRPLEYAYYLSHSSGFTHDSAKSYE